MRKLITSSEDARKISMTIKGLLLSLVPVTMALTGLNEDAVVGVVTILNDLVFYGLMLLSTALTLVGALRKVKNRRWSAEDTQ